MSKVMEPDARYEVRAVDTLGNEFVVGRTNHADGGRELRAARLHPTWRSPRVVDLLVENPIRVMPKGGKR